MFIVLNLIVTYLKPEFSIFNNTISEFAIGQFGIILNIALFCLGVANIATSRVLVQSLNQQKGGKRVTRIVLISGIFTILASLFNSDLGISNGVSWHGAVHGIFSILAFLHFVFAGICIALFSKFWDKWKSIRPWLIIASVLSIILLGFLFLPQGLWGIGERVFVLYIVSYFTWIGYLGVNLK
jgi:Protein of unknown function (DUF998)